VSQPSDGQSLNRQIGGRFLLLEELGHGGMGTVWRARDEVLGREVAVKELALPPLADDVERAESCTRAVREAQICARLRHPGIIVVHDALVDGGKPWIIMQLLRGRSLDDTLRNGPLDPVRAARIGLEILDALSFAHAAGVLHRDIKPGNIFLGEDGRAVLTDFGIASVEGQATITQAGMLIGSPGYMAPERLRGERPGPQSDLWSLAATLYWAVEGAPPHHAASDMEVLSSVLTQSPRPPRRAGELAPLLLAMLAKDPQARPAPAVVRQILAGVSQGAQVGGLLAASWPPSVPPSFEPPAPPPSFEPPPVPPGVGPRRGPVVTALAIVAVITLAGAAVGVIARSRPGHGAAVPTVGTASPGGTPSGSGPGTTAAEALFTTPFDACDLLAIGQVKKAVPRFAGERGEAGGDTKRPSCAWDAPGAGVEITLGALARSDDDPWSQSPAQAHERFLTSQRYKTGSEKVIWHYGGIGGESITSGPQTPAQPLAGIGEEAFVTDLYGRRNAQMTSVYFRVSNLTVSITHADVTGTAGKAAVRDRALGIARLAAGALQRQRGAT
jgi:hypothetical protein